MFRVLKDKRLAHHRKTDGDGSDEETVVGEIAQLALFDQFDHPGASQQASEEGGDEAGNHWQEYI